MNMFFPDTPARRVIRIIRIIRSYGLALRHRPRLPGIGARAKVGILPSKKKRLSSKPTTSAKKFSSCPVDHCLKFRRTCPA